MSPRRPCETDQIPGSNVSSDPRFRRAIARVEVCCAMGGLTLLTAAWVLVSLSSRPVPSLPGAST